MTLKISFVGATFKTLISTMNEVSCVFTYHRCTWLIYLCLICIFRAILPFAFPIRLYFSIPWSRGGTNELVEGDILLACICEFYAAHFSSKEVWEGRILAVHTVYIQENSLDIDAYSYTRTISLIPNLQLIKSIDLPRCHTDNLRPNLNTPILDRIPHENNQNRSICRRNSKNLMTARTARDCKNDGKESGKQSGRQQ